MPRCHPPNPGVLRPRLPRPLPAHADRGRVRVRVRVRQAGPEMWGLPDRHLDQGAALDNCLRPSFLLSFPGFDLHLGLRAFPASSPSCTGAFSNRPPPYLPHLGVRFSEDSVDTAGTDGSATNSPSVYCLEAKVSLTHSLGQGCGVRPIAT